MNDGCLAVQWFRRQFCRLDNLVLDDVVLSLAMCCLPLSYIVYTLYWNAVWPTKAARRTVEDTYPPLVWEITR